jgi:flagellar hook-associated protein 2
MDTNAIVDQLVSLERTRITQMEKRKSNYSSQLSIIQGVNSKLQSLQKKSESLGDMSTFMSYNTSSSDDKFVTATANGTAAPGTYTVEVSQLASAQRTYSKTFAEKNTPLTATPTTLGITVGSEDLVPIDVDADDTLETLASKINSSSAQVNASILSTVDGYRLQISGLDTGAENAITFTDPSALFDLTNHVSTAKDAIAKVDGFEVHSSSNTMGDALRGISLVLKDETTAPITINVSSNNAAVRSKIEEFVSSYNSIVDAINAESSYTGSAKGENRLAGDSTLRSLQGQLGMMVSSEFVGLGGTFSSLGQIGVTTDKKGRLSVNSAKLDEALGLDAMGVAKVFAGSTDGSVDGVAGKIETLVDSFIDYSDGVLTAKSNGINSRISSITSAIGREELRISKYEDSLRAQFTAMELMMAKLNSQQSSMANGFGIW